MVTGGDGGDGGGIYRVYHQKDIQMTAEAVFSDAGQDIPIWYNSAPVSYTHLTLPTKLEV